MARKPRNSVQIFLSLSLLLFTLASLCLTSNSALAVGSNLSLPSFADFSKIVENGQKDVLRGVYVDNVLALPVVQQPSEDPIYVTDNDGEVTQFGMATQYGNVGLLAHNHKAGRFFSQLMIGQEVQLIYGDGRVETFVIKTILKFQALQPTNPYSYFKTLNSSEILTTGQIFDRVYEGQYHITFQTCIAADGEFSWGRLFVIAVPKKDIQTASRQRR